MSERICVHLRSAEFVVHLTWCLCRSDKQSNLCGSLFPAVSTVSAITYDILYLAMLNPEVTRNSIAKHKGRTCCIVPPVALVLLFWVGLFVMYRAIAVLSPT